VKNAKHSFVFLANIATAAFLLYFIGENAKNSNASLQRAINKVTRANNGLASVSAVSTSTSMEI